MAGRSVWGTRLVCEGYVRRGKDRRPTSRRRPGVRAAGCTGAGTETSPEYAGYVAGPGSPAPVARVRTRPPHHAHMCRACTGLLATSSGHFRWAHRPGRSRRQSKAASAREAAMPISAATRAVTRAVR